MEYTLKLTAEEVEIVGRALQEIPFKLAYPLIGKLQNQVREQEKKPEESDA